MRVSCGGHTHHRLRSSIGWLPAPPTKKWGPAVFLFLPGACTNNVFLRATLPKLLDRATDRPPEYGNLHSMMINILHNGAQSDEVRGRANAWLAVQHKGSSHLRRCYPSSRGPTAAVPKAADRPREPAKVGPQRCTYIRFERLSREIVVI